MKILFLGDIVGNSGCEAVRKYLPKKIEEHQIDFVIANGENAASSGVGITEEITNSLFDHGVNVITTGNHVWDQKETYDFISREKRLLRPLNLLDNAPGKGFEIYNSRKGFVDTDNYFKDPWNQRDINDYIRYMHMPPTMTIMHPMEANTIYDPNRN